MASIQEVASGIFFYEFDGDTTETNISMISGWISANLGEMNNLIFTDLSGDAADFNVEQRDIMRHLYLASYYKKKARNAIKTLGANGSNGVLMIRDDDSHVQFVNINEVSKQFSALSKQHMEELNAQVYAYNLYQARPMQAVSKTMLNDVLMLTGTGFGYVNRTR